MSRVSRYRYAKGSQISLCQGLEDMVMPRVSRYRYAKGSQISLCQRLADIVMPRVSRFFYFKGSQVLLCQGFVDFVNIETTHKNNTIYYRIADFVLFTLFCILGNF